MYNSVPTYKFSNFLFEFLLGLRIVMNLVPAAAEFFSFAVNICVVVVIWILLFSMADSSYIARKITMFLPLYIITLFNLLFGYKSVIVLEFIYGLLQWFIIPVGISYLIDNKCKSAVVRLLILILICIVVTSITTILGNEAFPGASRALVAIWSEDAEQAHLLRQMNIGGFEFAYLLSLSIPILMYVLKQRTKLILSLLGVAFCVLLFITIYKTEYTTALVLAAAGLTIVLLPKDFTTKQLMVFIILGIVLVFTATELFIGITNHYSDTVESNIISERLSGISDILSGNEVSGDTESRQFAMKTSWQSFINNPLTGTEKSGGHSFILDTMAHFGVWGLLLVIYYFNVLFKLFVKPYKNESVYAIFLYVFFMQLFLSIVNPIIVETMFVLIIPLIGYLGSLSNNKRCLV